MQILSLLKLHTTFMLPFVRSLTI